MEQCAMASLKPIRWSCNQLQKHEGFACSAPVNSSPKPSKIILYGNNLLNSCPPFMDRVSQINASLKSSPFRHVSQANPTTTHRIFPVPEEEESVKEEDEGKDVNSQKLDQWVRDSAVEIVNNLGEAPFLVHIYCNGDAANTDGSTPNTRIKTVKEKAVADNWPMIEERWKGGSGTPNGVILVEELKTPLLEPKARDEMMKIFGNNRPCSLTKFWGILIQGKGKSRTTCYLLKTSQVRCLAGFCTHFCLVRVKCFAEHADIQLKKFWLQMG